MRPIRTIAAEASRASEASPAEAARLVVDALVVRAKPISRERDRDRHPSALELVARLSLERERRAIRSR